MEIVLTADAVFHSLGNNPSMGEMLKIAVTCDLSIPMVECCPVKLFMRCHIVMYNCVCVRANGCMVCDASRKLVFRVVFVTSPSYPHNDSRSSKASRNNLALATFNGSMKRAAADIGFQTFDEFNAFLTYGEEVICCVSS